jgi:hypothetical protein
VHARRVGREHGDLDHAKTFQRSIDHPSIVRDATPSVNEAGRVRWEGARPEGPTPGGAEVRFALETRQGSVDASELAEGIARAIARVGASVIGGLDEEPDLVIAIGGDGTMLRAARRALRWDIPVLGFDLGRLGFLTEAAPADLEPVVG